jgi:hypothetical protein
MSGPIYLGPDDPLEWLRGFVGEAAAAPLMNDLRELARRIRDLEPSAVEQLRPDDADPDCPAAFRVSNDGDGIDLHDLGRHAAAARWAIRAAVLRGWWRDRETVPSRAGRRVWAEDVGRAARHLRSLLRRGSPRDRMALQASGLAGGRRMLPAHPDRDGKGWLVAALESVDVAATRDLRRLGEGPSVGPKEALNRKCGDWQPDFGAGAAGAAIQTAAHDAVPIWLHFRPDARPTSNDSKRRSGQRTDSFDEFVAYLHEMATGEKRYVRRDVQAALKEYREAVALRYGRATSGKPRARRRARPV